MKRLLIAIAFLLFLAVGMAQNRRAAFFKQNIESVAGVFSPTNNASVPNLSWWVADGQMQTNVLGQLSNWLDAGVSPRNLTNTAVSTRWPSVVNNAVNGHAYVHFTNTTYLRNLAYTNASSVHELVMVLRYPLYVPSSYFFDSANSAARNAFLHGADSKSLIYAGTSVGSTLLRTNVWFVLDVLFDDASSGIWTNNVSRGALNPLTQNANGLTVNDANGLGNSGAFQVAEMVTYSASLGAVDTAGTYSVAAARSNLYVYLTNKYAIAP